MAQASCHLHLSSCSSAPSRLHASAPGSAARPTETHHSLLQIYPGVFFKLLLDLKPHSLSYPKASICKSTYIRPVLWKFLPAFAVSIGLELAEMNQALAQEVRVSNLDVRVSSYANVDSSVILDYANVLSGSKLLELEQDLKQLESNTSWKIRVLTTSRNAPPVSQKSIQDLWNPNDKTLIIVENLSSPNILNFNVGDAVHQRLPRQFFNELQSRYGNQFFVGQEGEAQALLQALDVLMQCLTSQAGCRNVPGLTNDLYFLTLATSIVGGCVFGFAARLPPSGRVEFSWQWVVIFSPLWFLLFGSFGILPILGRTSDWEPLVKNILGFVMGAGALYLTPIFGASPIVKRDE